MPRMINPQISIHASEGVRLMQKGLADQALASFKAGIARDPKDLTCLLGLARVYLSQLRHHDAKGILEQLLVVEPRHLEAQSHLAMLQDRAGDPQAFEKLKSIASHPKASFFELYNFATALSFHGDDENAEKVLEAAETFSKQNPQIQFERGRIALRRNDPEKALEMFKRAAALSPMAYAPLLMIARVHSGKGDMGQAINVLNDALKLAPREPTLLQEMYTTSMLAGSHQQALKAAVELCTLDPSNGRYGYLKGMAELASGDVKTARASLEGALELQPTSWEIKQSLARAYELLKEPKVARSLLEEARRDAPNETGPANDMALALLQEGKAKEAIAVLEPALKEHPDDPAVNLNMGLALKLGGMDRGRALECARKAHAATDKGIRDQAQLLISKLQKS
jgi:tetratricopeptide (TPR) repeat protein